MLGRATFGLLAGIALGVGAGLPLASAQAQPYEFITVQQGDDIKGVVPSGKPTVPPLITGTSATPPYIPMGQGYVGEVEPNGTVATASPLTGTNLVVRGNLYPAADVDYYSFTANAGDRVYAAVMTSFSAGNSTDSQLALIASNGTTTIEFDDDNGSFAALSSSIAGAIIPTTGTYYLRVNDFTAATGTQRGYELHLRIQSGTPTPETEPNDTPATANPLPANGWVSGARGVAAATEQDWYSLNLNAGDTVFLSLDLDPERDGTSWNGRLGFALFGDAANQILVVDDAGTGDISPLPNIPSEALFFTVKEAGTYFAFVDSATASVGGPEATYHLSVSVHPAVNEGVNCTTYTSTNVPQTIGPGNGLVSSTLTVPGNPRIADVDVSIQLNHALMADVDAVLYSPAGTPVQLFSDIGVGTTGGQAQMDTTFDDEAAIPPIFTALRGTQLKPENNASAGTASTSGAARLSWFDGQNAGGTWRLDLYDDTAGANGGTLTGWSIRICEMPPPPSCPAGFAATTVYSTDFESGDAGFTSSGTANEWEHGTPATLATTTVNPVAAFNTCNSGVNCWKTDLDNTYNANSSQDLYSPNINLAGLSPPVVVTWAQRHQLEAANFDHFFVDIEEVGGGGAALRLFEWLDPTPVSASAGTGNPQANIGTAIGWGQQRVRADSLAGLNTRLRFHLDSDSSVQFGGVAIDDVSVTACRAMSADLSITKSNGVATSTPGGSTTYTITASNAGPDPVTGATVADTFPASLTCTWTCVGAGGGTCTTSGSGNINDTVNLPVGGSTTHTATCAISPAATGMLSNTATVSSSITDPLPGNNSDTDSDTLAPSADLVITKTDGVTTVAPGGSTTYTITASNAGPSNAPGATVTDTFPPTLTCTWTCVGAGGGTCTASGSGNIGDTANLPAGGGATYTASCSISGAAGGSLVNTATVTAPGGVIDPTPGNNSATDTNTVVAPGNLTITPASLAFGPVGVGTTSGAQAVTLANTGDTSLQVTALTAAAAPFALSGGTCGPVPITLAGGAACSLTYTFAPTATGAANQTLNVTANAAGSGTIALGGTGIQGNLSITPTSVDFGSVGVGTTSGGQTVTLANTGGAPLQVTALTAAAAPFALSGGTCGATPITIADGTSCTLTYTFAPTLTGAANQTLSVTADVPGSGTIALTGTGVEGSLTITPASLDFGSVGVGNVSAAQAVTLANTGGAPLQVTALTAAAAPFALSGGTCGATPITIADGASCTLTYTFAPTLTGAANQTLSVTADVPGSGTIALTGTGVEGSLTITPASLDFGSVGLGNVSAAQTVTLTNTGGAPLQVTALTAATAPFALAGGTCGPLPITIADGASCTLTYTFAPTATGAANQTLSVTADVPGSGTIALTGTGVEGSLTITPASLDFGSVGLGNVSAAQAVTLANIGGAPLQVTALTAAAAPFALSGGTCGATPITIADGASCTLTYTFAPTATGAANQTLSVAADVPGSGTIALAGTGVEGVIGVLNAALNFGTQPIGSTSHQVLTIINSGTGPLDVTGITAATAPFAQSGGTCGAPPFSLAAGARCTVVYSFNPTGYGSFTQTLVITSNVGDATATLTGRGQVVLTAVPVPAGGAAGLLLLVLTILGSVMMRRRRA